MKLYDKSIIKAQMTQTTNKSLRGLLSLSILFMGSLLLIGTILDQLGGTLFQSYEEIIHKFNEGIFYSCIGLICVVLGLERALDIARIDNTLEKQNGILESIDAHISEYRQYKLLETYHDIYNISLQLIEKTRSNIRSVVYANSPKAPDSWNERVAEILKNKHDAGFPVQFDIVICINPEDMNEQFIEATERRFQIFKNYGSDIFFHRYVQNMEKTIGYDCLILDDCHLILSFPTILSNKTQKAVFFENQVDTVSQFINWFNSYAMFEAISMKTAIKNIKLKQKDFS
ncbi:MAG: hypothetical protein IPL42_10475 [Saprospiraceae bacterium]|nr:hypothetical protein [Saprospiraceae bacterium]